MKFYIFILSTIGLFFSSVGWGNDYSYNYIGEGTKNFNLYGAPGKGIYNLKQWNSNNYDLRPGVPDKDGSEYASILAPEKVYSDEPFSYMGKLVAGYYDLSSGPTFYTPASEVKGAWRKGWTGKGINILLVDHYHGSDEDFYHGVTTMMIADLVAIGATKYGLDYGYGYSSTIDKVKDIDGNVITSMVSMDVVNTSFGFNYWADSLNPDKSRDVIKAFDIVAEEGHAVMWRDIFNGTILVEKLKVKDAVIVKAAGNDSTSIANEPYVYTYASDTNISPRLIIVGATVSDGTVASKTSLASYSNVAGDDKTIADKFLVANGSSPYDTGDLSIAGWPVPGGKGTSYAAPRVAGYVAILRHKFPNLNAESSASILLNTARYDTLNCYPICPISIYGKGEASISRALAPIGHVR